MRQKFADAAGRLSREALEHVADAGVGIEPIELGRVDQAHHRCSPLASTQAASEQSVVAPERDRPALVLDPVVVDQQIAIVDVARERDPAVQAVVHGTRCGQSVGHLLPLLG